MIAVSLLDNSKKQLIFTRCNLIKRSKIDCRGWKRKAVQALQILENLRIGYHGIKVFAGSPKR